MKRCCGPSRPWMVLAWGIVAILSPALAVLYVIDVEVDKQS